MKELDANCEIIWVKIQRAKDIVIASFYMPHRDMNTLQEFDTYFFEMHLSELNSHKLHP